MLSQYSFSQNPLLPAPRHTSGGSKRHSFRDGRLPIFPNASPKVSREDPVARSRTTLVHDTKGRNSCQRIFANDLQIELNGGNPGVNRAKWGGPLVRGRRPRRPLVSKPPTAPASSN